MKAWTFGGVKSKPNFSDPFALVRDRIQFQDAMRYLKDQL